ncbi:MAG: fibrillarin-like rRNA/tRNA 2'-O-methyltransferase [Candidatus Methanomethylicia archaeon]
MSTRRIEIVNIYEHEKFPRIFWIEYEDNTKKLATINLTPGVQVYGEALEKYREVEYRIWNPFRSKLAASILNGISYMPIKPEYKVLYLGAASGTTSSHVSDIVGLSGVVYCVEFAARVMRELIQVCELRRNMIPIFADARNPNLYSNVVDEVDVIYCDVAQPNQAELLTNNAEQYLKPKGWIMLAIKARSIDVTKEPSKVYKTEINYLLSHGFTIEKENTVHLEPYDKDHAMVVARYDK